MTRYFSTVSIAVLFLALTLPLTACSGRVVTSESALKHGDYWQRSDASSAIYMRGPKAQQMLHRDISRCVTELRELRKLGAIRKAATPDYAQKRETDMKTWETPQRDGDLHAEHLPYHDFESCMHEAGWERVENLPYDIAEQARDTYLETLTGQKRRTPYADEQDRDFFAGKKDQYKVND